MCVMDIPRKALNTSSVKRVQKRIRLDALAQAAATRKKEVHMPTQAYIGRKGIPRGEVNALRRQVVDRVCAHARVCGGRSGSRMWPYEARRPVEWRS